MGLDAKNCDVFFPKNRQNRTFGQFFLEIGQNYRGRKYVHVFPWGRKHTVRPILSPLKNFDFSENLRF